MNIVAFPARTRPQGEWNAEELQQLIALFARQSRDSGAAVCWDIGATENGDPQFYILGPAPQFECLLCCSRLEAHYVLEDGIGGVLAEEKSLHHMLERAAEKLSPRRNAVVARLVLLFAACRATIEQKVMPVIEESSDFAACLVPELAAFV
ncbi:MAG: hypothetical protein J0H62_03585 [Rhizobiales bacterium]|nr:hypothetical protein [Hyphomicrobiales bacterium]